MNWRRGLLLAGINLAVAMPLVLWAESMDAAFMRDREHYAPKAAAVGSPTAESDEGSNAQTESVSFDPCHMIVELSTQERVLIGANFPAVALTEWRSLCPARWTLAGMLHAGGWVPTPSSVVAQRKVDAGLLLLIALQWFLLGAFPIKGPWKWREPGMFITLCSVFAAVLVFIPPAESFARLPAIFAFLVWFCWFALVIWRAIRSAWKWTALRLATNAI
jgi:hypothetical protein